MLVRTISKTVIAQDQDVAITEIGEEARLFPGVSAKHGWSSRREGKARKLTSPLAYAIDTVGAVNGAICGGVGRRGIVDPISDAGDFLRGWIPALPARTRFSSPCLAALCCIGYQAAGLPR
jgi:hypothetical protein